MVQYSLPVDYESLAIKDRAAVREQYVKIQNGLCKHCGASLYGPPAKKMADYKVNWKLFPFGFKKHPIHLHHDHDTGLTIGAVHMYCNAVLWQFFGE